MAGSMNPPTGGPSEGDSRKPVGNRFYGHRGLKTYARARMPSKSVKRKGNTVYEEIRRNGVSRYRDLVDEVGREMSKGDTESATVHALLAVADRLDRLCEIVSARR